MMVFKLESGHPDLFILWIFFIRRVWIVRQAFVKVIIYNLRKENRSILFLAFVSSMHPLQFSHRFFKYKYMMYE